MDVPPACPQVKVKRRKYMVPVLTFEVKLIHFTVNANAPVDRMEGACDSAVSYGLAAGSSARACLPLISISQHHVSLRKG